MELKERIVDTALRLFTDLGIKSVRMDDIASVCGISKRTLYEQFTDREHLVRQAIETYVKQQEAMLVGPMSRPRMRSTRCGSCRATAPSSRLRHET